MMNSTQTETIAQPRKSPAIVLPDATEATLQNWADQFTHEWRKGHEGIIKGGQVLSQAKAAEGHGGFSKLFKGHPQAIDHPFPIQLHTGEKLMRIAGNPALANPTNWSSLPIATDTLDVLSGLPEKFIESYIARGFVSPDMTGIDARALRYGRKKHLTRMAQAIQVVKQARAGPAGLMEHIGFTSATATKVHHKRLQRRELTESCLCQCRCGDVHPDQRLKSSTRPSDPSPEP
jgi:hypothetical protein